MGRMSDGSRKIVNVSEVKKAGGSFLEEIFAFDEVAGTAKATGRVPGFYPKLKKEANYHYSGFER